MALADNRENIRRGKAYFTWLGMAVVDKFLGFFGLAGIARIRRTVRLRHFTNRRGLRGIEASNVIEAGDSNRVFAVTARRRPKSRTAVEDELGLKPGKGRDYVEFDASPDEFYIRTNAGTGAREIIFRGDVDLNGRNPTFFRRS